MANYSNFRCSDMFDNGSYLRRRKRFKLLNEQAEHKDALSKNDNGVLAKTTSIRKTSFLIDHLLGNETSTNASFTSSSSSSSSEANSPRQQLLVTAHFDLRRHLILLHDENGHNYHQRACC